MTPRTGLALLSSTARVRNPDDCPKKNIEPHIFAAKPDVTLTISDGDLVDLMTGKLNSQKAFFQGKLKVQGNMGLAMKLQEFQKKAPKSKL